MVDSELLLFAILLSVTHAHHLKEMENPVSLVSCKLGKDSHQYYCVGTAFVHPDESEPKSGRLVLFHLDDGENFYKELYHVNYS